MADKSSVKDMTSGNIAILLIGFTVPLLLGNLFQMLYNTVDSLVVGNYVGKEALAAVGSTTFIVNMYRPQKVRPKNLTIGGRYFLWLSTATNLRKRLSIPI